MNLKFEFQIRPRHLAVVVSGSWNLGEILELVDLVKREADARQRDRVLTDLRQVEGRAPDLDRFYVGERVAAVVGKKIMLAVIAHAEEITHFAERVASNRGALISVVSPEPVALAWLER